MFKLPKMFQRVKIQLFKNASSPSANQNTYGSIYVSNIPQVFSCNESTHSEGLQP